MKTWMPVESPKVAFTKNRQRRRFWSSSLYDYLIWPPSVLPSDSCFVGTCKFDVTNIVKRVDCFKAFSDSSFQCLISNTEHNLVYHRVRCHRYALICIRVTSWVLIFYYVGQNRQLEI